MRYLIIIICLLLIAPKAFMEEIAKKGGKISNSSSVSSKEKVPMAAINLIDKLYNSFKSGQLKGMSPYITGKFKDFIDKMTDYAFHNDEKYPPALDSFIKRLQSYKVIHSFKDKEGYLITVFWILHLESRHQPGGFITQVEQSSYLVVNENNQFKIKDFITTKEFEIYNR